MLFEILWHGCYMAALLPPPRRAGLVPGEGALKLFKLSLEALEAVNRAVRASFGQSRPGSG